MLAVPTSVPVTPHAVEDVTRDLAAEAALTRLLDAYSISTVLKVARLVESMHESLDGPPGEPLSTSPEMLPRMPNGTSDGAGIPTLVGAGR
jgi:hypothetical protein